MKVAQPKEPSTFPVRVCYACGTLSAVIKDSCPVCGVEDRLVLHQFRVEP